MLWTFIFFLSRVFGRKHILVFTDTEHGFMARLGQRYAVGSTREAALGQLLRENQDALGVKIDEAEIRGNENEAVFTDRVHGGSGIR